MSYYVGSLKGHELKEKIEENITAVQSCGLDLKVVNCDQSTVNVRACKLMNITADNPTITINNRKIIFLYDVPHIFKNIRNRLIDDNFVVDGKEMSWQILKTIYKNDQNTVRMMTKLTDAHINPNPFQKQSVKMATQVLFYLKYI